ncbi:DUF421 domain-containing protein [Caldicellulosiruptoraceae bacterium PP1]
MVFLKYLNIIFSTTIVYLFLFITIRLLGKKEISQLSLIDLVFILLISNSVQNAMVGSDSTLVGGLISAASLILINYFLKLIIYRFPKLEHFVEGEPILLIYNGKINSKNLSKAKITVNQLNEAVREHGLSSFKEVKLALLEIDGNISIISNEVNKRFIKKKILRKMINEKN